MHVVREAKELQRLQRLAVGVADGLGFGADVCGESGFHLGVDVACACRGGGKRRADERCECVLHAG